MRSCSLRASNRRVDSSSNRDLIDSSSRVRRNFISSLRVDSSRSSVSLSRRSSSFSISERSSASISERALSVCIPAVFASAPFIPERRSACSCNRRRRSLLSDVRILRSSFSRSSRDWTSSRDAVRISDEPDVPVVWRALNSAKLSLLTLKGPIPVAYSNSSDT